jgi:rubrerythrin
MTTLEKIIQDLSNMDEKQLEEVSALITTVTLQSKPLPCDRENILDFIQHTRSQLPQRTAEDIDQQIREERDSWEN